MIFPLHPFGKCISFRQVFQSFTLDSFFLCFVLARYMFLSFGVLESFFFIQWATIRPVAFLDRHFPLSFPFSFLFLLVAHPFIAIDLSLPSRTVDLLASVSALVRISICPLRSLALPRPLLGWPLVPDLFSVLSLVLSFLFLAGIAILFIQHQRILLIH